MVDLSIRIVNWNTGDLLENCIKSIIKNTKEVNYEIIVCDNDSKDDSANRLNNRYEDVNIIYSKDNLEFAKGNNLAFRKSKGSYILLLNPDTIIQEYAIDRAYKYIIDQNEDVLLGAKLLNFDYSVQLSSCNFPTLKNMVFKKYIKSIQEHKSTHETDWVMGAFMMLKSDLYEKVGKLDEDFFMYSEDMDLCYQVKKIGGKVIHFSEANVIHLYNQSGAKKCNDKREKVITESFIKFLNKNYKRLNKESCKIAIKSRYLIKCILGKLK